MMDSLASCDHRDSITMVPPADSAAVRRYLFRADPFRADDGRHQPPTSVRARCFMCDINETMITVD
jgi:hypothetical protein